MMINDILLRASFFPVVAIALPLFSAEPARPNAGLPDVCAVRNTARLAAVHQLIVNGRFAEAQPRLEAALEKTAREDSAMRACLMSALGFVALQRRRPDEAIEWLQRGLELDRPPDGITARLTYNLACAYVDLHQFERAEEAARRARTLAIDAFGPEHPETLFAESVLASVYFAREDFVRAEPVSRRLHWHAEKQWGEESYEAAVAAGNLAMIYTMQRRFSEAQPLYLQSLRGLEKHKIRSNDEIPLTQVGLALCYAAKGRAQEAEALLEQALRSAEAELGPQDPSFPVLLERAANARFLLKDNDGARQLYERALSALETQHGRGSAAVLVGLERYAELLREVKDKTHLREVNKRRKTLALRPDAGTIQGWSRSRSTQN